MLSTSNNTPCNKFECRICGKIYKRNSGLTRHMATIKDANSEKLKQHSRHVGNYKYMFKGVDSYSTLSHILGDDNWGAKYFLHHQKTFILSYQLPSNPCDSKESYQCQESDPLQEPDTLKEFDPFQHHTLINTTEKAEKQRTRKPRPVQIIIGWKKKLKSDKYSI
ncbi:hypothetical protein RhiirC2_800775 [Rhizophagus irregularis]|uniref:C2H2-type domain-containing protein n=1 Tax=Rhizophagus irregularis TaxID=588596 RepID=A0A2N1M379_9GLOM|nr:hypothetical protein RhiirC2_800775 [Rhizophagus irregularis]